MPQLDEYSAEEWLLSPERATAYAVFTTGTPKKHLRPRYLVAAEEAVRRGDARWAPVTARGESRPSWRLRWNLPGPR